MNTSSHLDNTVIYHLSELLQAQGYINSFWVAVGKSKNFCSILKFHVVRKMFFPIRTRMANGHTSHGIRINNKYTHSEELKKNKTKQNNPQKEQSYVSFSEARILSPLPQFLGTTFVLLGISWIKARGEPQHLLWFSDQLATKHHITTSQSSFPCWDRAEKNKTEGWRVETRIGMDHLPIVTGKIQIWLGGGGGEMYPFNLLPINSE